MKTMYGDRRVGDGVRIPASSSADSTKTDDAIIDADSRIASNADGFVRVEEGGCVVDSSSVCVDAVVIGPSLMRIIFGTVPHVTSGALSYVCRTTVPSSRMKYCERAPL